MVHTKCTRCGAVIKSRSHQQAELDFNQHKCKGMRSLDELPTDLLRKLACGTITEEQAWEQVAIRRARVEGVRG